MSSSSTSSSSTGQADGAQFALIGRADVAEVIDRNTEAGQDQHAEQCISGLVAPGFGKGSRYTGAVYIDLSLKILQRITSHITT